MGKVYCAYSPGLEREVAVKVIHVRGRDLATQARAQERLLAEARIMAKVAHANVVTIHDVGTEGDQVYFVMERIAGKSLREWVRGDARGWADVLRLFVGAGRGLAAVHRAGVVHSDVKPENILVQSDGEGSLAKVSDFGVARLVRGESEGAEQGPSASYGYGGTPFYEAPEVAAGRCDARSDVYSLAVTLFEALCGGHPYARSFEDVLSTVGGDEDTARLRHAMEVDAGVRRGVILWTRRGRALPRWVRRALERGVAVDPAERFASMDALVSAIDVDRRRTSGAALGVVAAVGMVASAAGASWVTQEAALAPCRAGEERFAAVWSADTRAAVASRDAMGPVVARMLDQYGGGWKDAYESVCVAGSVERSISPAAQSARMACLSARLEEVKGAASHLSTAAPERQLELVSALRPVSLCGAQVDGVAPPSSEAMKSLADEARARIAEAYAHEVMQDFDAAYAAIERGGRLALQSGYGPVIAEAEYQRGRVIVQDALRRARPSALAMVPGGIEALRRAADRAAYLGYRGLASESVDFAERTAKRLGAGGLVVDVDWALERSLMLGASLSDKERAQKKLTEGLDYLRGDAGSIARGQQTTSEAIEELLRLRDPVGAARGLRNRGDLYLGVAEDEATQGPAGSERRLKDASEAAVRDYREALRLWSALEGRGGRGTNGAVVKTRLASALRFGENTAEARRLWEEASQVLLGEGPCEGEGGNAIVEYLNGVEVFTADEVPLLRRAIECSMLPQKRAEALMLSVMLVRELVEAEPNPALSAEAEAWEDELRGIEAELRKQVVEALERAVRRTELALGAGDPDGARLHLGIAEEMARKADEQAPENSERLADLRRRVVELRGRGGAEGQGAT
ncbi:MAG: serine/threonine protein kinase [Nannocystis sp.]|nr:serine/threonine protein kinase [Nannocystis sp.]